MTRIGTFRMPQQPQKPPVQIQNETEENNPKNSNGLQSNNNTTYTTGSNPPPQNPIGSYKDFMNFLASKEFLTEVKGKGVDIESKEFREYMDNYVKTHPADRFTPTTKEQLMNDVLSGWEALKEHNTPKNYKPFNNQNMNIIDTLKLKYSIH